MRGSCAATTHSRLLSAGDFATCSSMNSRMSTKHSSSCSGHGLANARTFASWATQIKRSMAGTGADAKYLTGFTHWFPAAVTLELLTNHRSAAPVVAAAAAVLGDRYITVRKPIGPDPTVAAHQTPGDEAADIADRIRWKHGEGGKWSSHAVLARTNAQLDVIADALSDANIPFRIRGRGHVSARPGAKAALEALTKSSDRFAAVLVDLELDESVDNDTVLILELGRDYTSSTPSPSGPGFAQWMRTIRSTDLSSDTDAVDLVTFHASKGLEWTHISIIGFEDGLVPMNDSDEDPAPGLCCPDQSRVVDSSQLVSYPTSRWPPRGPITFALAGGDRGDHCSRGSG